MLAGMADVTPSRPLTRPATRTLRPTSSRSALTSCAIPPPPGSLTRGPSNVAKVNLA
jgi:hypothetical protein